ncbi:medium-chain fatty acid-CoA ligase faa2 [Coemansia sp. BCRC 34301]|nr:medium-chain fatty acid-CoA ligase faa2 [Coemansia sp. BCRC 34301]
MSFKVPSSEVPGYSAIYRNSRYKDGTQGTEYAHITTAHELYQHQLAIAQKGDFLGTRQFNAADGSFGAYEWMTASEVAAYVDDFGSGLDQVFAQHAPDTKGVGTQQPLGIYSINRAEWLLAEFSAFRSRRYSVGVCDTVSVDYAEYIINHSDISVVVCSIDKIPRMLDRIALTPNLRVIVSMDQLDCSRTNPVTQTFCAATANIGLRERAGDLGIVLFDAAEVIEMGRKARTEPQLPTPDDIYTVCYTSGTTGAQKGALISHAGLVSAARGLHLMLRLTESVHLSFAPLMHCLDRFATYMMMFGGVRIGFFSGDLTRLLGDIQALRPTVLFVFPMLLDAIHRRIAQATVAAGGIKGLVSRMAFACKLKRVAKGTLCHALWDRVLFGKIAATLGGRIRMIVSGGKALNQDVAMFFRAALSCQVLEGYGQTEAFASGTGQPTGNQLSGHMGVPCPGNDIRLRNRPEIGYLSTDQPCPRGELMIRSKSVFVGYLKEPEKTSEAMDGDWLATGDIVQINGNGTFSFISRVNNHFKTSTSTWISPERLENIYSQHTLVKAMFVHGNARCYKVVAIVVPDPLYFLPWARAVARTPAATLEELCENAEVVRELAMELRTHAGFADLSVHEQLGAIAIEPTPFTEKKCGLCTATLKLKRQAAAKYYDKVLERLFSEVGEFETPQADDKPRK